MSLPSGYEGLILSGEQAPVVNLPQAFRGIVLSYNNSEKFIRVQSNRGVAIVGAVVTVSNYINPPFTATTGSTGTIEGIFDLTGIIPVRVTSGKTFYDFTIDGADQEITTILTFPTELT